MGLGIHKDSSMTVYTIPLMGGGDEKWEDNTWIVEHLRQLACKIEESRMKIISIGSETINASEPIPELIVKGFENYPTYEEALEEGLCHALNIIQYDNT